ncbi:MAG: TlpA family protein disulfide reductase [Nitrospirota bacterium]|nr:MAG: TlpA family protein disulfide reductase [Nitrospirota bacterium]
MTNRISIVVVICLLLFSCQPDRPVGTADVGQTAPDFKLRNLNGSQISLSSFKGKVVLLEFWATWCPPCRTSVPDLNELQRKFVGKDFKLLTISVDDGRNVSDKLVEFNTDYGVIYSVLIDDDLTSRLYGITSIPVIFLLDKDHNIVKKYTGYSPGLTDEISQHIEELL